MIPDDHPSHSIRPVAVRPRPGRALKARRKEEDPVKILIALDDSPHSERAVQFVTRVRWPAGSRVIVATVMRPAPPVIAPSCGSADAGAMDQERRIHHEAIVTRAQDRLRAAGMSTEGRILEGDPR